MMNLKQKKKKDAPEGVQQTVKVVEHVQHEFAKLVADVASIKAELEVVKAVQFEIKADAVEMKALQSLMNKNLEEIIIQHENIRIQH